MVQPGPNSDDMIQQADSSGFLEHKKGDQRIVSVNCFTRFVTNNHGLTSNNKTCYMRIFLVTLIAACLLTSCDFFGGERVRGNGRIVTEQKNARDFQNVSVSGGMNIRLKQGNEFAVNISTDENLMQYVDVFVEGNTLVVREKSGYNLRPSKDIVLNVTAPAFGNIGLSGSGNISSENTITGNGAVEVTVSGSGDVNMDVDVPSINSSVSGSATIALKGHANKMKVELSGSGKIRCFDLNSDDVAISISGSANAEVVANYKLDVEVSGSGDVVYKGNASVTQSISGSGSVRKVD
jgi:hypothetical protein